MYLLQYIFGRPFVFHWDCSNYVRNSTKGRTEDHNTYPDDVNLGGPKHVLKGVMRPIIVECMPGQERFQDQMLFMVEGEFLNTESMWL